MANIRLPLNIVDPSTVPAVCLWCGDTPATLTEVKLPYVPTTTRILSGGLPPEGAHLMAHSGGRVFIALVGLPLILYGVCIGKRVNFHAPLCERHLPTAWWHSNVMPISIRILSALSCFLLVAELFFWWQGFPEHWWIAIAASGGFLLALYIRARNHDAFLNVVEATESDIELAGVSEQFVNELATFDASRIR